MFSKLFIFFLCTITFFLPSTAFSGGFYLSVLLNKGNNYSYSKDVVLVVKPLGCHKPADAVISGTAEGIINGSRQSFVLKFQKTDKGEFTCIKQWPDEGVWVLSINGTYNNLQSSALVEVGTNYNLVMMGSNTAEPVIKTFHKKLNKTEIESVLKKQLSKLKKI